MKFFDLESPLMQALNKVADLMILNILTLICCIPIITAGASITAMHYMALKMARNEECYIIKDFFKSFKLNFKQATIIWVLVFIILMVLVGDFYIMFNAEMAFAGALKIILTVIAFVALFTYMFLFPVLAKFDNTILRTFKNAFFIGILQFPKTILMMILSVAPVVLFLLFPQITPIIFCFGMAAPAWLSAKMYSNFFKKLEDQITAANALEEGEQTVTEEEDERIFKDELDESLLDDPRIGGGQA
ncbi:MAG: DUF624 domain-containing protein [Lachnospiraceae bacterium]|jgi:uncharacterized membrane protein YesL|nr:DUF624 domain-containing protein [Lachnospiraceae bacterium]